MPVDVHTYERWTADQKAEFEQWLQDHGYNVLQAKIYKVDFPEGAEGHFIVTRYGEVGQSVLEKVEMKSPPPNFV